MKKIVIIGAGVTGSCIARELSRRNLDVLVVEKGSDVCEGTSKANSGIVHAGFDAKPGSLKARLNVEGNEIMGELSRELDFPFKRIGSLVLCFDEKDFPKLKELYDRGLRNGVKDMKLYAPEDLVKDASGHIISVSDPDQGGIPDFTNLSPNVAALLYAPTGGIVDPFLMNIAFAENAAVNGVDFLFDTEVKSVRSTAESAAPHNEAASDGRESEALVSDDRGNGRYILEVVKHPSIRNKIDSDTPDTITADVVINAAGVYADIFHNMVSADHIHITPRKGEYCLLDKKTAWCTKHTLFQLPTEKGKGILVTPTTHGNILVGPTAVDTDDAEAVDTTAEGLDAVIRTGSLSVAELPSRGNIITSFAGLRAHEDGGDFIIGEVPDAPGFIDAAGIESPGLTCAPAIGRYVAKIVDRICPSEKKADFIAERHGIISMASADEETRKKCIAENPKYARVVCRCELVTEGEITDAINRPLGAVTLDGIKRRVRAGMGRCQAGFCTPRQTEILARELGVDPGEITKKGAGSELLEGFPKV